jgi:hypothetical protein
MKRQVMPPPHPDPSLGLVYGAGTDGNPGIVPQSASARQFALNVPEGGFSAPAPVSGSIREAVKNLIENRGGVAVPGNPAQVRMPAHPKFDALGRRVRDQGDGERLVDFLQIDQDARARDEALRNRLRQEAAARQAQAAAAAAQPGAAQPGGAALQDAIRREVSTLYPKYPKGTTFIDELRGHDHRRRFFEPGDPEAANPNWSPRTGYVPKLPTRAQLAQARSAGLASFLGQSQEDRLGRVANATVDATKNSTLMGLMKERINLGALTPEQVAELTPLERAEYLKEHAAGPKGLKEFLDNLIQQQSPEAAAAVKQAPLAKLAGDLQASRETETFGDRERRIQIATEQAEITAKALADQMERERYGMNDKRDRRDILMASATGDPGEALRAIGKLLRTEPHITKAMLRSYKEHLQALANAEKLSTFGRSKNLAVIEALKLLRAKPDLSDYDLPLLPRQRVKAKRKELGDDYAPLSWTIN